MRKERLKKENIIENQMKCCNSHEQAITLIALVVTIVVLLILAGVSISLVLGQNGLINNAKEAKNKTLEAEKTEGESLNNVSEYIYETTKVTEIKNYSNTAEITEKKIDLNWDKIIRVADEIATNKSINKDTAQVVVNIDNEIKTLTVGDYTSVKYDNEDKKVRLIGFNYDDLADGTGKAGMTFEFITTIDESILDSGNNIEEKGWEEWDLRQKMPEYLEKIDAKVRENIQPVTKKYGKGIACAGGMYSCTDSLWLLGWGEITLSSKENFGNDGDLYRFYGLNNSANKYARYTKYDVNKNESSGDLPNSEDQWSHVGVWLRSAGGPYYWSHTMIEYKDESYDLNCNTYGTSKLSVAPAFCIGSESNEEK